MRESMSSTWQRFTVSLQFVTSELASSGRLLPVSEPEPPFVSAPEADAFASAPMWRRTRAAVLLSSKVFSTTFIEMTVSLPSALALAVYSMRSAA
jgi:hypothetical protein